MSHNQNLVHLFLLSPTDTPLYSMTHLSTRPAASSALPLSSNLPSWSTSVFADTVAALSGATSGAAAASNTNSRLAGVAIGAGQDRHIVQLIANASLDVVEETLRLSPMMYLRGVDKFNEWTVSAFVTPGNMKFILLHDAKSDDGVKLFFTEVWELYVKTAMNPFHTAHTQIRNPIFDARVRASAKKHL